jgi:Rap1a immunity proteins
MKYIRPVIALGMTTLLPFPNAHSQAFTASDLYQQCLAGKKSIGDVICSGYIRGVMDGMTMGRIVATNFAGRYCPPKEGTDFAQGRLIVENYFRGHPEDLQTKAGILAGKALIEAFPCR